MTKDEAISTERALDLALEALEESVDLVREDYDNAKKLYSNYPSRQARLLGLEDGLSKHEKAITAIKQARSAPAQEPVAWMTNEVTTGTQVWLYEKTAARYQNPPTPLYTTPPAQPAPVQSAERGEPVAFKHVCNLWIDPVSREYIVDHCDHPPSECIPAYIGTPPGGRQSEDCLTAAQQEIQRLSALVRAQQITIEKLEAQRPWTGLTDEDKLMCWARATHDADVEHKTEHQCLMDYGTEIEAKLRSKNNG